MFELPHAPNLRRIHMKPVLLLLVAAAVFSPLNQTRVTAHNREATVEPPEHSSPGHDAGSGVQTRVDALESQGRLKEAAQLLADSLAASDLPSAQRKNLEFEL